MPRIHNNTAKVKPLTDSKVYGLISLYLHFKQFKTLMLLTMLFTCEMLNIIYLVFT